MKIKFLFLTVFILAVSSIGFAQSNSEVKRLSNETAENFAKRNGKAGVELVHQVIETDAWNGKKSIFAFYEGENSEEVDGYVFVPKSAGVYQKILIYNFEPEGGTPKIEAFFFANADKDKAKELVVICSWDVNHYDVNGTLYQTYVFDDISSDKNQPKLKFLENVSKKVSGGCDCDGDGANINRKYKTAAQVKAGLKKLGF